MLNVPPGLAPISFSDRALYFFAYKKLINLLILEQKYVTAKLLSCHGMQINFPMLVLVWSGMATKGGEAFPAKMRRKKIKFPPKLFWLKFSIYGKILSFFAFVANNGLAVAVLKFSEQSLKSIFIILKIWKFAANFEPKLGFSFSIH